jgi:hypothetical protein
VISANENTQHEQDSMTGDSGLLSLDNIEVFREAPKKENDSPRQYNQDLMGLLWAYTEAEKRVLSLRAR